MALEETEPQMNGIDGVGNVGKEKMSVMDKLKDPTYRSKVLRWLCIPIGVFTVGILDSQSGPTLHDLEIITSTDGETSALFFTAGNLGYIPGSFISSFLFGKINSYLMMFAAGVLAGLTSIATPYCATFALMFFIRCTVGIVLGILFCTAVAEHMLIWRTNGEALLQLINCVYAVGGILGPLIASPFVADKEINKTMSHLNVTLSPLINHTETTNSTLIQTSHIHSAYLIAGTISIFLAIPFLIIFFIPDTSKSEINEKYHVEESCDRKLPLVLTIFILVNVFIYFFTYFSVEITFNSYIATFVVKQFQEVSSQDGAYMSTYFWASFAAARFLIIFISKYIIAVRLMYLHLSLVLIALSGFTASAFFSRLDALTVFTCAVGVACSAIYPAAISWVEAEIMTVSGPVFAVILIGGNTGAMLNPFIVGYLMEKVSNLWFCYTLMIALALAVLSFGFLLLFNRLYVDKRYGKLHEAGVKDKQNHSSGFREETSL